MNYSWSFGDGTAYSGKFGEQHDFAKSGDYNVCVQISDGTGCTAQACQKVKADLSSGIDCRTKCKEKGITRDYDGGKRRMELKLKLHNTLIGWNKAKIKGVINHYAKNRKGKWKKQKADRVSIQLIGTFNGTVSDGSKLECASDTHKLDLTK